MSGRSMVAASVKYFYENPSHVLYVRVLDLASWRLGFPWQRDPEDVRPLDLENLPQDHLQYVENDMNLLRDFIRTHTWVPIGEHESWFTSIKFGSEQEMAALLVTMFSNLRRFVLAPERDRHRDTTVSEMIDRVQADTSPSAPLRNLKTAEIRGGRGYIGGRDDFHAFIQFIRFTWITELVAHRVQANISHSNFYKLLPLRSSNVTSLSLFDSEFSGRNILRVLEAFKQLRSLTWTIHHLSHGEQRGRGVPIDPNYFRVGLLAFHQSTLQSLVFRTQQSRSVHIGEMRGFDALKHLEMEHNLLIDAEHHDKPSALLDTVPKHLEHLRLHISPAESVNYKILGRMIKTLVAAKHDHCPGLECIQIIYGSNEMLSEFLRKSRYDQVLACCQCEAVCLTVTSDDESFLDRDETDSQGDFIYDY